MGEFQPPHNFQERMRVVSEGQQAAQELPMTHKILEERQERLILKMDDLLENRADSATLKDELHELCIALHEARVLWHNIRTTVEGGERMRQELDEEIMAPTGQQEG